jgi:hypothetical protein
MEHIKNLYLFGQSTTLNKIKTFGILGLERDYVGGFP